MDVAARVIDAVVVAVVGLLLAWFQKGRFASLERRMDRMEARLDGRMETLQASQDAMRSDLTHMVLALRLPPAAENG